MNELEQRSLAIETKSWTDSLEVGQWLAGLSGEGWVCFTDRVERFRPGSLEGHILSAEVAHSERQSVTLRFDNGTWRAWIYEEGDGGNLKARDESFISNEARDARKLCYRVYHEVSTAHGWEPLPGDEQISVWRPYASRFLGFAKGAS